MLTKNIIFSVGLPFPNNILINSLLPNSIKAYDMKYSHVRYMTNGIILPIVIAVIIFFILLSKYIFIDGINKLYPNEVIIIGVEKIIIFLFKKLKFIKSL